MSKIWAIVVSAMMIASGLWVLSGGLKKNAPLESESEESGFELMPDGSILDSGEKGTRATVPRIVCLEDFTNYQCGGCPAVSDAIRAALEDPAYGYDVCAPVFHHVDWPGANDPWYLFHPTECEAMISRYAVGSVPKTFYDGLDLGTSSDPVTIQSHIDSRLAKPSKISITSQGSLNETLNTGSIDVHIVAEDPIATTDFRVMFCLWEHNVTDTFGGNDPLYEWGCWDLVPDQDGVTIWPTGASIGDFIDLHQDFTIEPTWNIDEIGMTVYVQDISSREIEQAHVELFDNTAPEVTILSPAQDIAEQIISGSYDIAWSATDIHDNDATLDIKVEYSPDAGLSWNVLEDGNDNNDGTYTWDTNALSDDVDYMVRVTATDSTLLSGSSQSAELFSIENVLDDRWYLQIESTNLPPHLNLDMKPAELPAGGTVSRDITGTGEFLIQTFASGYIATYAADLEGDWNFSVYGKVSNCIPAADGQLYANVYANDGVSSALLFTTGYDDEFVGSYLTFHEFYWTYSVPDGTTISIGDRIVVEIMLHATAGSSTAFYKNHAGFDIPVESTVANDYTYTQSSNNQYETLTEITKNLNPALLDQEFWTWMPTGWAQTGPSNQWGQEFSNKAGGTSPEARFEWVSKVDVWRLYTGPIDTTGMTSLDLEWNNFYDDWTPGVNCTVQTSSDAATWHNTSWIINSGGGNVGPGLEQITITTSDVGSSTFYVSWTVDGNAYCLDYWYIDDVLLQETGYTSMLEHKWLVTVPTGKDPYEFSVEASRPITADLDNFLFAYSTDDITYIDMVTVNTDTDSTYTYPLPASLPGNVFIRVRDTDRNTGNTALSSIDIDEMFIASADPSRLIIALDHYTTPSYIEPSWSGGPPPLEFSTLLGKGWNMISIPLNLADTTLASVLSSIVGNYSTVWCYDAADGMDHWKVNSDDKTSGNDLSNIEREMGIWIYMTSADTLSVSSSEPTPPTTDIQLKAGWNFVGYPSSTIRTPGIGLDEAFESISTEVKVVQYFNASDPADPWKEWGAGTPGDLTEVKPGYGLWIYVTSGCIWTVDW